ncbi:HTH_48 domain-containing protein [Trichonephila clavipes]|nr:HTH_48 domain-containing protein [Trichonephila clavipes]
MVKIEYRAVNKYLFLKGNTPTQIKDELDSVFGDSSLSFTTVKVRGAEFKRGLKSLRDDERLGRLNTATTDENVAKIHQMVLDDHRIKEDQSTRLTPLSLHQSIANVQHDKRYCHPRSTTRGTVTTTPKPNQENQHRTKAEPECGHNRFWRRKRTLSGCRTSPFER